VECDGKDITALREALFQLGDPSVESKIFRVTGHMLFVPFSESEAWSHSSILGMAKAHVHQMSQLQQPFIRNINGLDELLVANNGDQTTVRSLLASVKQRREGIYFILSIKHQTKIQLQSYIGERKVGKRKNISTVFMRS
jgi:hypothetical protein